MPRLLYRAMIGDLLRVGALTTVILVTVIAFGATIKPLSQDSLITAGQFIRYIGLACVPMLQFALPFASGFAGTMSLHRMAVDNEVLAAAVSGLSYRRILMPVGLLGAVVALLMVALTQAVIPRFWGMIERTVAHDVALMLEGSVGRGEPFRIGDLQIWADELVRSPDPPEGADTRLHMFKVAVADLDAEGRVVADVTAAQLLVDIYRTEDVSEMRLVMEDAVAFKPADGVLAWIERQETTIELPHVLEEGPKRMSRRELLNLRLDPDVLPHIDRPRMALADRLRGLELFAEIDRRLQRDGLILLQGRGAIERAYVIYGNEVRGARIRNSAGAVEVVEMIGGEPRRRYRADRIRLRRHEGSPLQSVATGLTIGRTSPDRRIRINLELSGCTWHDVELPDSENVRAELLIEALELPDFGADDLLDAPSRALLLRAQPLLDDDPALAKAHDLLTSRITALHWEIHARLLKRYAMSSTALLLILLGATMAMWLREAAPLSVYLWAFLPSVLDLILISSGEHMMRDGDLVLGGLTMWSGNAILLAIMLLSYHRLSRN